MAHRILRIYLLLYISLSDFLSPSHVECSSLSHHRVVEVPRYGVSRRRREAGHRLWCRSRINSYKCGWFTEFVVFRPLSRHLPPRDRHTPLIFQSADFVDGTTLLYPTINHDIQLQSPRQNGLHAELVPRMFCCGVSPSPSRSQEVKGVYASATIAALKPLWELSRKPPLHETLNKCCY